MKVPDRLLPDDGFAGTLVGRIWLEGAVAAGPRPCVVREDGVFDVSALAPTMAELLDRDHPAEALAKFEGPRICALDEAIAATFSDQIRHLSFLAPCDLQAIKAAGVTFVDSMLERVIEERAKGDPASAAAMRRELTQELGLELSQVRPGSSEARAVKERLLTRGLWSQYLEVGLGPDAEIFTKAQPMSAVGTGATIGLHPKSEWNNPEPEIVLACNPSGGIVGATLGNDVNLRDFEGRSALLLSKAKDNNASCAIGPFIRLFDETFSLDDVRRAELSLEVIGEDGFRLDGTSSMARISRDPTDLVAQTLSREHQYPDGFLLFCGTLFTPTEDRDIAGGGFTHKIGDVVQISAAALGTLANVVTTSDLAPPWTYGVRSLVRYLQALR